MKDKPGRAPGFIGPCQGDSIAALKKVIQEAEADNKGLVFMLWKNEPNEERKSVASLTVGVAQDRPQNTGYRARPIGNAPARSRPDPLSDMFGSAKSDPDGRDAQKKGW